MTIEAVNPARSRAAQLARLQEIARNAATDDEARTIAAQIRAFVRSVKAARWEPYPWQRPHIHPPGWVSQANPRLGVCDDRCADLPTAVLGVHEAWVNRAGRGCGKTDAAAHYVNDHVNGPPCDPRVPGGHRLTISAPTQADAVAACITGVSGIQSVNPEVTITTGKEGTIARWPNGAVARVLGANSARDVERARAWSNICVFWLEEFAAMPYAGGLVGTDGYTGAPGMLDQAPFTLRLGSRPHIVATTTPTGRPEVTRLLNWDGVQTWGRTRDAIHLDPGVRASLENLYPPGSTLARQELDGEQVGDIQGALWVQIRTTATDPDDDRPGIDNDRVPLGSVGWKPHGVLYPRDRSGVPINASPPEDPSLMVSRVAVGVDPAGGATETGISVVGEAHGHSYTLADLSLKAGPDMWGKVAVLAAYEYGAEGIALERTYGGDQTEYVIRTAAEALGLPMPALLQAPTVEGKSQRAIPVQALAQNHRVHHVGLMAKLEGEQTTWVEGETKESPNRLDAWVHANRHLLVRTRQATFSSPRQMGRR